MSCPVFNPRDFGAVGDGVADDATPWQAAIDAALAAAGSVYAPAGRYRHTRPLGGTNLAASLTIKGDGPRAAVFMPERCDGLALSFAQVGQQQPYGLTLEDVGFEPLGGASGIPVRVSYGSPAVSNDHYEPSTIIRNVVAASSEQNWFTGGIDLTSAWNPRLSHVFVTGGGHGGNWGQLAGNGFALHRSCVNAHFDNCSANFFANGFTADTGGGPDDPNTEGILFSNCSFVAVRKGLFVAGNPNNTLAPRISGLRWTGGLIECRQQGTFGGAAVHLVNVWDAAFTGAFLLSDEVKGYGAFIDACKRVKITGCDVQGWQYALCTTGPCAQINSHGNDYANCQFHNILTPQTTDSRSFGHTADRSLIDLDLNGGNKIGFV